MDSDTFWSIIEKTTAGKSDQEAQLEALYDQLDQLTAEEIEGFDRAFQQQLARAYSWDLWGADFVIHGGASDDAFEYFLRWLISLGRESFEAALADADDLADIIPEGQQEPCEFEEIGYVAMDVWTKKTGIDAASDPASTFPYKGAAPGGQPAGTPFKDSESYLSRRYPKLWERFGEDPLG